ncbi:MAG: UvrD-helicase domain-containing protein, partial [Pseudomonadota bacterium]
PILAAYQAEKARRALLDFDDLIVFTRRLLTTKAVTPWVLYKLDGGLSHILLDEAQDTSPPQWDLINALVEEFHAGAGSRADAGPRTQFVVGDPKQSIYSFQGADQSYFAEERQAFVARETAGGALAALPDMTMSFRSCPQILGFVDEVAARVPLASAATDPLPPREADLQPHAPRRIGQAGLVELWPLCMPQKADGADRAWTAPVDHMPKDAPRRRLAKQIAKRVREMIAQGDTVWREQPDEPGRPWQREAMAPEDVLILVRRRGDLFEALIDSLKDEGLPVAGADRLKLLDNIGVQDCLNLIRFVLQPADDLTLAEILRGPFCNLTDDDNHLFPLAHGRAAGETLWSRLVAATGADFAPARAFLTDCLSLRDAGAFAFLSAILMRPIVGGATGLDRLVHRLGDPVRDPIEALVRRALSDDSAGPASLQAFLAGLEGDQSELKRDLGEPAGAIRVMTVHGAKGLQAPVVILPDTTSGTRKTDDQIFFADDGTPLYAVSAAQDNQIIAACRAQKNDAQERESRRLLYVAMTRAQDRLIICGAGTQSPAIGYASSSWYRWCLLAMQGLTGQAVDDEAAEMPQAPLYHGALPPRGAARGAVAEAASAAPSWLFEAAPAVQAEGPQFVAPSALIADTAPVRRPLDPARAFGLRRGRLIHALLQVLPELAPDARGAHATRFLARAGDLSDAERAEIHDVTFAALDHPEFAGVFGKGGRSEAAIAGALPDGRIVNGRVDRLVVRRDEVLVVDYKTDRPAPRHARDVGASYLAQMAAYRAVLQQIYADGRPVRCALLYTDGPRLIELDMDLLSESLNRLNSEV